MNPPQPQQPQQPRVYLGKPENQKDPTAVVPKEIPLRQPTAKAGPKRKTPLPRTLPKPSALPDQAKLKAVQMTASDPSRTTLFPSGTNVREVNNDTLMTPSVSSIIEVSRIAYRELVTDDPNINKAFTPEYLDYYATCLLWMRITTLKQKSNEALTVEEEQLLRKLENVSFAIPEPLLLQYKILGRVETLTHEHLRPSFPSLPTEVIAGFGGYFGPLGENTHNLYEEIPTPGVLGEAVRHAISEERPGPYPSALAAEGLIPNENLLGYMNLQTRRPEAKNLAFDAGITPNHLPSMPRNSGINLKFLMNISDILAQTKTFKISHINFVDMAMSGGIVQATMQHAVAGTDTTEKRGEIYPTSNFRDQDSVYAIGLLYTPNLYKEANTIDTASEWACVDEPPHAWIVNRNIRREAIPPDYQRIAFRGLTQSGQQFRKLMIHALVLTQR